MIARAMRVETTPSGGVRLRRLEVCDGIEVETIPSRYFPPDPDVAAAMQQAVVEGLSWVRMSPPEERRHNYRQRIAINRLRLTEMRAADYLPTVDMRDLTAAIDFVVDALRSRP